MTVFARMGWIHQPNLVIVFAQPGPFLGGDSGRERNLMSQMGMSQNLRTSKTSYERAYLAFFWVNIHKPQLFWC